MIKRSIFSLLAILCLSSGLHAAETPNPVTPGYQICTKASGSTICSFQAVDLTHGLPVDLVAGSVTANLAPFTPAASGSRGAPLTVSTVDVSGTIPTNTGAITLSNPGATLAYCNVVGAAATTADFPIAPGGGAVVFGIPNGVTTFHCISIGSGTTINSVGGSGLAAFTGGGGSGGGAVTIADGADVTQGSTVDAPCASGSTTPCTIESRLANLENIAASPIPAGTNIIGKAGIDQTTPGTTNGVQVNASALPTGAATSANQIVGTNYGNQANWLRGTSGNVANTAATTVIAAPGSNSLYVTGVQCFNSGATASAITLNDSAATVLFNPAGAGVVASFQVPLKVAATTALTMTPGSSSTNQWCNAQAYNAS